MDKLKWTYKAFDDLSALELYHILKLRSEIFVVEQNCVYLDADNRDQLSFHLCAWNDVTLVAYARILAPGVAYEEPSIGRVSTFAAYRNKGAGRMLMEKAIELTTKQFPGLDIRIGAQLYLENFYRSLGFKQSGGPYIEDGIPHIHMLLSK